MRRLWIWFQSLSRFGQFGVVSLSFHAALILILLINHVATVRPSVRRPIQVRMKAYRAQESFVNFGSASHRKIDPNEEDHSRIGKADEEGRFCKGAASQNSHNLTERGTPSNPAVVKVTSCPAVVAVSKKAAPAKAKEMRKVIVAPKNTPQKARKADKESYQATLVDQNLLQQIVGSLDAIGTPEKALKPSHFAPRLPPSIEIQSGGQTTEARPGYGETISAILQSNLDLPEFGQVVAKIEINAVGSVTQCEILQAKSRKNGEFLKKRLRELVFPCFNEFGISENHLNFTITFHNAENR